MTIRQPAKGYRAGVDAVLLAAAVPAKAGEHVLELGCGVGTASLCLRARVTGVQVTGVEVQAAYAALARDNGLAVVQADLRDLPVDVRNTQFDHVMMNPPYFDRSTGSAAPDAGRDIALGGDTSLADWIAVGLRRVRPKGTLTVIQRMERLPEVMGALGPTAGSVVMRPIAARSGTAPTLFLLQVRHSGRTPFVMAPVLVMHEGDRHLADAESYTAQIAGVLRGGDALPMSS